MEQIFASESQTKRTFQVIALPGHDEICAFKIEERTSVMIPGEAPGAEGWGHEGFILNSRLNEAAREFYSGERLPDPHVVRSAFQAEGPEPYVLLVRPEVLQKVLRMSAAKKMSLIFEPEVARDYLIDRPFTALMGDPDLINCVVTLTVEPKKSLQKRGSLLGRM